MHLDGWWLIAAGGLAMVSLPRIMREARSRVFGPFLRPKLALITVCLATGAGGLMLLGVTTQLGLASPLRLGLTWATGVSFAVCLLAFLLVAGLDLLRVLPRRRAPEHRTR